ncbi:MAG TPA: hypothetical protein PLA97_19420 [Rubrivivax sp.]|nr:hypothetical protein [Rubrivivax sp.]
MRLLLDECVPARLRQALPSHQISTVVQEGWSGIKNGRLLAPAAEGFDALITVDKNLPYQQNVSRLPVAVLVPPRTNCRSCCRSFLRLRRRWRTSGLGTTCFFG